jgi:hypothetical protein
LVALDAPLRTWDDYWATKPMRKQIVGETKRAVGKGITEDALSPWMIVLWVLKSLGRDKDYVNKELVVHLLGANYSEIERHGQVCMSKTKQTKKEIHS